MKLDNLKCINDNVNIDEYIVNRDIVKDNMKYPDKIVDLKLYECKYISGNFKLHDHSVYKFVNKEELLNYDLCPADIPLAEYVKEAM